MTRVISWNDTSHLLEWHESSLGMARVISWNGTSHLLEWHESSLGMARVISWNGTSHLLEWHESSLGMARVISWNGTSHLLEWHESSLGMARVISWNGTSHLLERNRRCSFSCCKTQISAPGSIPGDCFNSPDRSRQTCSTIAWEQWRRECCQTDDIKIGRENLTIKQTMSQS